MVLATPPEPQPVLVESARVAARFDLLNPETMAWIEAHSAELVREIVEEQRLTIRKLLTDGLAQGLTPQQISKQIRETIGLTAQQAGYVAAYEARLGAQNLPLATISRLVNTYRQRWIRNRADTIARHELVAASNEGQRRLWAQAVDNGFVDPVEYEQVWIITPDSRLCPKCRPYKDMRAPIGGYFPNGKKGPPAHVRCRCVAGLTPVDSAPPQKVSAPDWEPPTGTLKPKVPKAASDRESWIAKRASELVGPLQFAVRRYPAGHPKGGQFMPGDGVAGGVAPTATVPSVGGKLLPVDPIFHGAPVATKKKLNKPQTGAVGEQVVTAYLREHMGLQDARPLNRRRPNAPIDVVADHSLIEVKAGMIGNTKKAQQWRITEGEPGKVTKAQLKKMDKDQKAEFHAMQLDRAVERKNQKLAALSQKYGRELKPVTMTMIVNPDTNTAQLYRFEGFHMRIGWTSKEAKAGYVGTFRYG